MTPEKLDIILDVLAALLAAFMAVRSVPLLRIRNRQITAASFIFAMVSLLLTYAYWLAYSMIRPDVRMPLSANTIGECATFLLLSVTLDSVFRDSCIPARPHIAFTALFAAADIALWIAWSGEWNQDILGGVVFGYFLCVCVRCLVQVDALSRPEWIAFGAACVCVIASCVAWSLSPETLAGVTEVICCAVMYAVALFFLGKTRGAIRRKADPRLALALSIAAHAWSMNTMYMTSGYFYNAAMLLCLLTLPLMRLAVKREAEAA